MKVDGALAGNVEELRTVIDIVQAHGPQRGLYLSGPKTTVWCPSKLISDQLDQQDPLGKGISLVKESGIVLLGSPIGSLSFQRQANISRIQKIREITRKLHLIKDPHVEFTLLRTIPKIMFTLRTTNPVDHMDIWTSYDNITREALSRIVGTPLSDLQWVQAVLPVSMGGLGLRASSDHAGVAYTSSFLASLDLKEQILGIEEEADDTLPLLPADLVARLEDKMGTEISVAILRSESQKEMSLKVDQRIHKQFTETIAESGNTREIARISSLALPYAGAWLNVTPSPALGLHLRPSEFVLTWNIIEFN